MAEVSAILCPHCHKPNQPVARYCQHCGLDVILNNDGPGDGREYVIERVIKEGGMGAVYMAVRRPSDGNLYAVKEMLDRFNDPKERTEALDRFNAEAELLKGLKHPRIPRIYSHFADTGRHYLVMDFVEGGDLEDVLQRDGALPEKQVLEYADQICDVLSYLHGQRPQVIFRDMKPSNVMIDRKNGGIKLVDFGIAKVLKVAERGTQIGTPGYAPPEQYQGIASPASDIYALGATLHHMLTGRDPRDEKPFDYPLARDLNPNVSRRTSDAIQKALQMKPEDRWGSVAEFRAQLRPLAGSQPFQARVSQPTTVLPPQPQVSAPPSTTSRPAPPQPAPQAKPAKPAPTKPAPQPKAAPQPAPIQPTYAAPRRFGFGSFLAVLLLLAALGVGALYVAAPDTFWGVFNQVQQQVPQQPTATAPATATPVLIAQQRAYPVEVTLPATSDDATVRTALTTAFLEKARAEFGPAAVISQNAPPVPQGGIDQRPGDAGTTIYSTTMQGFVSAPQP
jgi:serine/threonine-protein kinase